MKETHLFYAPDIEQTALLPDDEAGHAVRVLRMKEGDPLWATDGLGHLYHCTLALASPKRCSVQVNDKQEWHKPWQGSIHIAVAPTKNMDRMEWFVEKATEIGADGIHFIDCANSERHVVKAERIDKIAIAATKQSQKGLKPVVEELVRFKAFISRPFEGQRFIAHCYRQADIDGTDGPNPFLLNRISPSGNCLVLIGPEGDFSIDEVKAAQAAGFQSISLGESRLRTETAALVAVQLMNLRKSGHA